MRISARTLAFVIAAAVLPSLAIAHGLLRSSSPAANSVIRESPRELLLTFTEAPERRFTTVRLFGPAGEVQLDSLRLLPGKSVAARVESSLSSGTYRVEWLTAGADGHPVSGAFTFSVVLNTAGAQHSPSDSAMSAPPPSHVAISPHAPVALAGESAGGLEALAAILRWLTLVGTVATIGVIAFRATVIARVSLEVDREISTDYLPAASSRAASLGAIASATVVLSALARLFLQSRAMHGSEGMLDPGLIGMMLADTAWGRGWILHVVSAAVALLAFLAVRRARYVWWYVAGIASLGIAVSLAMVSHAATLPRLSGLSVIANLIHVVAASGWLGNLLVVFAVGLPLAWRLDRDDRWTVVRDIVNAFSPAALAFGATAGATGVFMAWTHVGSISALFGTDYGRVLLLKVALLSITALTGAYNWLRVRPSLGDETGAARLRSSAAVELTVAAMVLAVTAVLVALPMPDLPGM
jgi:putative copper export protein/methionine-rich copper-binding protein CopC